MPGQDHHQHDHHNHHHQPNHHNDQYDYYSNNPASENSVDIAAPIVSALQTAPTKAQVMMMVMMTMMDLYKTGLKPHSMRLKPVRVKIIGGGD